MTYVDVVIVGAGPYGLSIAAHLKAHSVDFRIFGQPMQMWREHMPKGMRLKSEGFASSLSDPDSSFTLEAYCNEKGIPYAHTGLPVPLDVFSSYGMEFQKRFVPELVQKQVESVSRSEGGFRVRLEDGSLISSRRVIIATGLTNYEYTPTVLAKLPEEFMTHSSRHHEVDKFQGMEIAIVGAGASALDLAAAMYEAGSKPQVIARKPRIRFHDPPDPKGPSLKTRLRAPMTGIGPGWQLVFFAHAPLLFRKMPQDFRLRKVRQTLGPAPCWFTKQQVVGKVPMHVGVQIKEAVVRNGRVSLELVEDSGARKALEVDHVISATGYKVDLGRLTFLDSKLYSAIQLIERTPVLSSNFESSVPGLYFVGIPAANTFGPLLRFAVGAEFTAPRIARHLAKSAKRKATSESVTNVEITADDRMAVR
jgi:thioredoxin reductase